MHCPTTSELALSWPMVDWDTLPLDAIYHVQAWEVPGPYGPCHQAILSDVHGELWLSTFTDTVTHYPRCGVPSVDFLGPSAVPIGRAIARWLEGRE